MLNIGSTFCNSRGRMHALHGQARPHASKMPTRHIAPCGLGARAAPLHASAGQQQQATCTAFSMLSRTSAGVATRDHARTLYSTEGRQRKRSSIRATGMGSNRLHAHASHAHTSHHGAVQTLQAADAAARVVEGVCAVAAIACTWQLLRMVGEGQRAAAAHRATITGSSGISGIPKGSTHAGSHATTTATAQHTVSLVPAHPNLGIQWAPDPAWAWQLHQWGVMQVCPV